MLPVVPKRRYLEKEKELDKAKLDLKMFKNQVNLYKKALDESIKDNTELNNEWNKTKRDLEDEKNVTNNLNEIIKRYESKELTKKEKERTRLENIAKRTKSPYTKSKIENRILKDIENEIKKGVYIWKRKYGC